MFVFVISKMRSPIEFQFLKICFCVEPLRLYLHKFSTKAKKLIYPVLFAEITLLFQNIYVNCLIFNRIMYSSSEFNMFGPTP